MARNTGRRHDGACLINRNADLYNSFDACLRSGNHWLVLNRDFTH
jgi:hypothetical protein